MKPSSLAAQPALPGGRLGLSFFIRYGFLVILLAFLVFFSLQNPIFLTLGNWGNLLQGSAVLLIVALAMTLVVTAGGIDLSVGVALDFGAAFALVALKVYGLPWQAAVLAALAGGALVGLVNAVLIIHCRIKPFLATLGTWFIGSSIERIYTEGGGPIAYRRMAPQYHELAVGDLWGIPVPIVIVAVLWFAYYLLFERTIAGKRIHAMGLNAPAALIAGVNAAYDVLAADCHVGDVRHRRRRVIRQSASVYAAGRTGLPDGRDCRRFYRYRVSCAGTAQRDGDANRRAISRHDRQRFEPDGAELHRKRCAERRDFGAGAGALFPARAAASAAINVQT